MGNPEGNQSKGFQLDLHVYRHAKTVIIHKDYRPEDLDRSYHDIALIKFDKPFYPSTVTVEGAKFQIGKPICLPPSDFDDENRRGGYFSGMSHH